MDGKRKDNEEIGGFDYISTDGQAGVICAKNSKIKKRDWGNKVKFTCIIIYFCLAKKIKNQKFNGSSESERSFWHFVGLSIWAEHFWSFDH